MHLGKLFYVVGVGILASFAHAQSSYTATEQYVNNKFSYATNFAEEAVSNLRQGIKAADNSVTVSTNANGDVLISATQTVDFTTNNTVLVDTISSTVTATNASRFSEWTIVATPALPDDWRVEISWHTEEGGAAQDGWFLDLSSIGDSSGFDSRGEGWFQGSFDSTNLWWSTDAEAPGYPHHLQISYEYTDLWSGTVTCTRVFMEGGDNVLGLATTQYVSSVVSSIPKPDYATNNTELVATIETVAPVPGNYATVSNAAMSALQPSATNGLVTADEMVAGFGPWYFSDLDGTPWGALYFVEDGVRVPVTVSWVTSPSAGWFPTTVGTNIDLTAYIIGDPYDEKDANLAEWVASDYDTFREENSQPIIGLTFSRRLYRPMRTSDLVNDGPPREDGIEDPDPYVTESRAATWMDEPFDKTLKAGYIRSDNGMEIANGGRIEIFRDNYDSSIISYGGDGIEYKFTTILFPYLPYGGTYTFATTDDIIAATNGISEGLTYSDLEGSGRVTISTNAQGKVIIGFRGYGIADTSAAGLMSASDKTKLDQALTISGGIATNLTIVGYSGQNMTMNNSGMRFTGAHGSVDFVSDSAKTGINISNTDANKSTGIFVDSDGNLLFLQDGEPTESPLGVPMSQNIRVRGNSIEQKKPLQGRVFDFSTMSGFYEAISNIVEVMGGTIMNYPAPPQK